MPQDIPNLCVPDFGKADLPKLLQDLPKWKQWLSSSSNNNWNHFTAHTLPALKQPTASPWPLTTWVPSLPNENSSVPIDEDLEDLFEKEQQECKVCSHERSNHSTIVLETERDHLAQ